MSAFLLSAHVVVAILAVGPIAVAASMFPRYARALSGPDDSALSGPDDSALSGPDDSALPVATVLHRICRTYAVLGLAVPVLGFATAVSMGVLTDAWVLVSIALTAAAAVVLLAFILPDQRAALDGTVVTRLAMTTGIFNLLWVIVTVLMIVRPGSSTGV
ncbi:hypothetical protein E4P42_22215 [Mycobacterium sp. PS03-16]|uniref:hypothetical protein n=1 Tax=Mycobacterium sp. PS03-16 TaxID=2559611 RepID=UPI001073E22E|nr:hypothetical protein [Mycobacterium sp. PS03-16]TFV55553.1 hypothetical protein E4P42_22215 [Mycobacterium sp. PS03-16]